MDDMISRQAALDALGNIDCSDGVGFSALKCDAVDDAITVIKESQPVDAVPVVHGRWVHHPEIGWGSTCLCSECGEKTVETVMGEPRYKFCPMCGADMRKDGDGNDN